MYEHKPASNLDREERNVKELLRDNMQAAVERLREDADSYPNFNQMVKDLYYGPTPPVGATVVLEPIINRHGPTGERWVEVWNQHVLDGKSITETVAVIDDRGGHRSVGR